MSVLKIVLEILPLLIQIITAVESLFKGVQKSGTTKKDLVLEAAKWAREHPKANEEEVLSSLVDIVVEKANKGGAFATTQ